MKVALITGITGQDGSYLAEQLLAKRYEVHGLIRRASTFNTARIDHIFSQLKLHHGDMADALGLCHLLERVQPNEVYNLAAQSHVRVSFDIPAATMIATGLGTLNMLEAVRLIKAPIRYYQASSSEMYGKVQETPQTERTPFYPRSPYGCAKVAAYWLTVNYRESYGIHASNGILFNHESERRGETFVTRKIAKAVARIKAGKQYELLLGNLDARRDWGYAPEYTDAMWRMLQQDEPDDYVIATGETHSVREFVELAFNAASLDWKEFVRIDPRLFRPAEVDLLLGNPEKAKQKLGWIPEVGLKELVQRMVWFEHCALL